MQSQEKYKKDLSGGFQSRSGRNNGMSAGTQDQRAMLQTQAPQNPFAESTLQYTQPNLKSQLQDVNKEQMFNKSQNIDMPR